jgi:hypothetical protein
MAQHVFSGRWGWGGGGMLADSVETAMPDLEMGLAPCDYRGSLDVRPLGSTHCP